MYNVAGMTDKNKDSLIKDLLDLGPAVEIPSLILSSQIVLTLTVRSGHQPLVTGLRYVISLFFVVFVCNHLPSNLLVHWSTI